MKKISAKRQALKDISKWIRSNAIQIMDGNYDVWIVTSRALDTKEQRRLNRELGKNEAYI